MNLLNSALIASLDMEKFHSKEDVKLSIENFYEESFEQDFEKMQNNPSLFEESERKIKLMVDDYIQLRNLKFFKVGQIILVELYSQKYIAQIYEINDWKNTETNEIMKNHIIKIKNICNIRSLEKLIGSLEKQIIGSSQILQILEEDL